MAAEVRTLLTPRELRGMLERGFQPPDKHFDAHLGAAYQGAADLHFTPLIVILFVARWLEETGVTSVVDVGAGAGKFCVAAACYSKARFVGIEQRQALVEVANHLARRFELRERVFFVQGTFGENDVPDADAYYFYNPFGENLFDDVDQLDLTIERSRERYDALVEATLRLIDRAKAGTYFIFYNGFGGSPGDNCRLVLVERSLPNVLQIWQRTDQG